MFGFGAGGLGRGICSGLCLGFRAWWKLEPVELDAYLVIVLKVTRIFIFIYRRYDLAHTESRSSALAKLEVIPREMQEWLHLGCRIPMPSLVAIHELLVGMCLRKTAEVPDPKQAICRRGFPGIEQKYCHFFDYLKKSLQALPFAVLQTLVASLNG